MQIEFLRIVQSYVARIAIGPSTVRGRGNTGVAEKARAHLRMLNLSRFGTKSGQDFSARLDEETESLLHSLPEGAQKWGLARKIINIFLRDCAYSTYLAPEFRLSDAEEFYEIPLDSITAGELVKVDAARRLQWLGIKHLTPEVSMEFQRLALSEAKRLGVHRMHLDAYWWSHSRDDAKG